MPSERSEKGMEFNMKLKALKNDDILIEKDKFNLGVSSTLSRAEKNTNTPVVLKSLLNMIQKRSSMKRFLILLKILEIEFPTEI